MKNTQTITEIIETPTEMIGEEKSIIELMKEKNIIVKNREEEIIERIDPETHDIDVQLEALIETEHEKLMAYHMHFIEKDKKVKI